MILIFRSAAILSLCFSSTFAEAKDIQHRKDVQTKLQQILCSDSVQLEAQRTIALGIYDAQIDARIIESIAGNALTERMLEKKSKALAAMKRYHGYAHGICSDRKGWVAAIPAPAPMARTKSGFKVDFKDLDAACKTYRIDYAAHKGGESQSLAKKELQNFKKNDAGMIEISCQPSFPRWKGPIVWYLAPTDTEVSLNNLDPAIDPRLVPEASIKSWMSAVRKKEGLPPVTHNNSITKSAEFLTIDTSVTHNRSSTDGLREKIKTTDNINILGELRVRGQSASDLVWMIWHSPRHRDLILSQSATTYGIHVKQVGTELLAVILTGQEQRPVTAARDTKTKKPN